MKAVALTRYLPIDDPQSLLDVELPKPAAPAATTCWCGSKPSRSIRSTPSCVRRSRRSKRSRRCWATTPPAWSKRSAKTSPCSSPATRSITPATSPAPAAMRNSSWSTHAWSGASRQSLDFAQAAALPLTTITAWELLFQRMPFDADDGGDGKSLLVIAGAGGVGSIAIQLARHAGFTVIATASRAGNHRMVQGDGRAPRHRPSPAAGAATGRRWASSRSMRRSTSPTPTVTGMRSANCLRRRATSA